MGPWDDWGLERGETEEEEETELERECIGKKSRDKLDAICSTFTAAID